MEKVILAFEGERTGARVRDILEGSGTAECVLCRSAAEVKRMVYKQRVTTVVCGYKLRDETAEDLCHDLPLSCSVLVLAVQNMLDMIESDDIYKLAAPVSRSDFSANVNAGRAADGTFDEAPTLPGRECGDSAGEGPADGAEQHVGRASPSFPSKKEYGFRIQIDPDRPNDPG